MSKWFSLSKENYFFWVCLHKWIKIKPRLKTYKYYGELNVYSFVTPLVQIGLSVRMK